MLNYETTWNEITLDGFYISIDVIHMSDVRDSKAFLHDLRALIKNHYGSNAYSFKVKYFELEVVNSFG